MARFRGKQVWAHVCDINDSNSCSLPATERVRCMFAAVQYDIKHPNVMSLIALSIDPSNNPILLYDYYPNGSLHQYVGSHNDLSENDLLALCMDVCNGMYAQAIYC